MANIAKWHNPASGYPLRLIAIDYTGERDALTLRAAGDKDERENTFDPTSELGDLWLTLQKSGMPISATNFVLYGKKTDPETGLAIRIEAAVRNEKKPQYGYAYKPEQLAGIVPKNLFMGAQLKMHGAPLFMVSELPYVAKARVRTSTVKPKPAIVRVTAAPIQPEPPKRQRG